MRVTLKGSIASASFAAAAVALTMAGFMASAPSPAIAQDEAADGYPMVVRARGARGWTANCTLDTDRGRQARPKARGRGATSSGVLVGRNVVGGACTAEAGERGPLELVFEDEFEAFACPFNGDEACRTVVAAGDALTFTVALK